MLDSIQLTSENHGKSKRWTAWPGHLRPSCPRKNQRQCFRASPLRGRFCVLYVGRPIHPLMTPSLRLFLEQTRYDPAESCILRRLMPPQKKIGAQ